MKYGMRLGRRRRAQRRGGLPGRPGSPPYRRRRPTGRTAIPGRRHAVSDDGLRRGESAYRVIRDAGTQDLLVQNFTDETAIVTSALRVRALMDALLDWVDRGASRRR